VGKKRVLENKVLRKVLGSYTKEVKEDWRKLHNEQFMLYTNAPSVIRLRRTGHVECTR